MNKNDYFIEFTSAKPEEIHGVIIETRIGKHDGKYPPAELTLMRNDDSLGLYLFTYVSMSGVYTFACATLFNKSNRWIRICWFRFKVAFHILTHKVKW